MSETVIKVENLYKEYKLGTINNGTLHRDLQSWWAKLRGKEDPNSVISHHHNVDADTGSFLALNDVSFEVKKGEVLGIIGRNGAGKSTLLKILSRITAPTSGEIKIKGRIGSLLEVGTGFHPELTGRENIYMNGAILGMRKHEITAKLEEIIAFAEIEKFIDTPVKRYSSGMYVRLAFAVAAHLDPEILVVDEVLAVGDANFQKKCLGKMGEVAKEGRTVLFVSHNMGAVRSLCDRGILLDGGNTLIQDTIENVIDTYLGSVQKANLVSFESRKGDQSIIFTKFRMYPLNPITGSNVRFDIDLLNKERRENSEISISFKTLEEKQVLRVFSKDVDNKISFDGEKISIKIVINELCLIPGNYKIDLWLGENNIPYDWINDVYYFTIKQSKNKQIFHNGYQVYSKALWENVD